MKLLCIGGKRDGKTLTIADDDISSNISVCTDNNDCEHYTFQSIRGEHNSFHFYLAEGLILDHAIHALIDNYKT